MERDMFVGDSGRISNSDRLLARAALGGLRLEPEPTRKVCREMPAPKGAPHEIHEDRSWRKLNCY